VITPRKSDLSIDNVALAWTPWHVDAAGIAEFSRTFHMCGESIWKSFAHANPARH
jgi:hypothetical protein